LRFFGQIKKEAEMRGLIYLVVTVVLVTLACSAQITSSATPNSNRVNTSGVDHPVLKRMGPVFIYETSGPRPAATMRHRVRLDNGITLSLYTPASWNGHRVGNAAWFDFGDTGARLVIYPPERSTHENRIREFYALDRGMRNLQVSELRFFASERRPFLYTIERTQQNRNGLVYALLTEAENPDSGIIMTSFWPASLHDLLRPMVLDIANSVTLERD
jgi:hypothetical protein